MGLPLNSEGRRYPSEQIWPRDVVDAQTPRWLDLSELRWDLQMNWIIICYFARTWDTLRMTINDHYRRMGNNLTEVRKMLSSLLVSIENELGTATQTVAKGRALSAKG
jgi:hypothetical protein